MCLNDSEYNFRTLDYQILIDRVLDSTCLRSSEYDRFRIISKVNIFFPRIQFGQEREYAVWLP